MSSQRDRNEHDKRDTDRDVEDEKRRAKRVNLRAKKKSGQEQIVQPPGENSKLKERISSGDFAGAAPLGAAR